MFFLNFSFFFLLSFAFLFSFSTLYFFLLPIIQTELAFEEFLFQIPIRLAILLLLVFSPVPPCCDFIWKWATTSSFHIPYISYFTSHFTIPNSIHVTDRVLKRPTNKLIKVPSFTLSVLFPFPVSVFSPPVTFTHCLH